VHLSAAPAGRVRELLTEAWLGKAPKRLIAEYQQRPPA
jgi:hypothetical protein